MKTLFVLDDHDDLAHRLVKLVEGRKLDVIHVRCVEDGVNAARVLADKNKPEVLAILDMMLPITREDLAALDAALLKREKVMSRLFRNGVKPRRMEPAAMQQLGDLDEELRHSCELYGGIAFLLESVHAIAGWRVVILSAHSIVELKDMIPPEVRVERFFEKPCLYDDLVDLVIEFAGTET